MFPFWEITCPAGNGSNGKFPLCRDVPSLESIRANREIRIKCLGPRTVLRDKTLELRIGQSRPIRVSNHGAYAESLDSVRLPFGGLLSMCIAQRFRRGPAQIRHHQQNLKSRKD